MVETRIETHGLSVWYGGVHALSDVSLAVPPGELHGVIGPNGSGKSTFLAAISRLTHVTRGRMLFDGFDFTRSTPHGVSELGLARTFQTVRLLEGLSVLENVKLGAEKSLQRRPVTSNLLRVLRSRKDEKRATERSLLALDRVGLIDQADEDPASLSYGTQRKVEIARAIAGDPKLLLLDEPTAGMNRAERDEVSELLLALRDAGLTQILVEHDLSMIHETCDHVWALNFGNLIAHGSAEDVVQNEEVRAAYIGAE